MAKKKKTEAPKGALPPFQMDGATAITGRLVCYAFRPGAKEIELDWEGEAHAPADPAATPGMTVRVNVGYTGRLVPKGFLSKTDHGAMKVLCEIERVAHDEQAPLLDDLVALSAKTAEDDGAAGDDDAND